jgi:hypothetical protein
LRGSGRPRRPTSSSARSICPPTTPASPSIRPAKARPSRPFRVNLDEILCVQEERQVMNDNCVSYRTLKLQIPESPMRPTSSRRASRSTSRASRSGRDRQDTARDRICVVSRGGLFGASVCQRERRRRAQPALGGANGLRDSRPAEERGARRRDENHCYPALA